MNIHAFYAFAFLVLTIGTGGIVLAQGQVDTGTAPAAAVEAQPVATPVISAPTIDDPVAGLTAPEEPAQLPEGPAANYQQPVCVVSGKINDVQTVELSPWDDGTPTTLTTTEVRVSLTVESRAPQRNATVKADCSMPATGSMVYKLCSPTQLAKGMRIKGVEGLATGSNELLGCLFDVAILPKDQVQPVPQPAPDDKKGQ